MRVEVWRTSTREAARAQLLGLQMALESQMRAQTTEAGLRCLRQVLASQLRGALGLRIEVWRTAMQDWHRIEELVDLQLALEMQIRGQSVDAGLRLLRQIFARALSGSLGLRVEIWRCGVLDERRAEDFARLQARFEAQTVPRKDRAGLQRLWAIMKGLLKGEAAVRVEVWRMAAKRDCAGKERQMLALRQLRWTLIRFTKGDVSMRLDVWHSAAVTHTTEQWRASVLAAAEDAKKKVKGVSTQVALSKDECLAALQSRAEVLLKVALRAVLLASVAALEPSRRFRALATKSTMRAQILSEMALISAQHGFS